jgi:hypothetical protein
METAILATTTKYIAKSKLQLSSRVLENFRKKSSTRRAHGALCACPHAMRSVRDSTPVIRPVLLGSTPSLASVHGARLSSLTQGPNRKHMLPPVKSYLTTTRSPKYNFNFSFL